MNLPLIKMTDVALSFADMNQPVLAAINYEIGAGDFVILLGSNGSGKSSLLKILSMRYTPTSGQVMVAGKNLAAYSARELSQMMVTLSQNSHESLFPNLTLKENFLLTQARAHEKKSLVQFCKHLEKFNLNLVSKLDTLVMKLSGGEKQALMLALAVLHPPKILLLDEHTSALDPNTAQQLMKVTGEIVAEYGITCVLTTHDLGVALGFGERIVSLRQGKILRLVEKEEKHRLQKEELLGLCY